MRRLVVGSEDPTSDWKLRGEIVTISYLVDDSLEADILLELEVDSDALDQADQ